MTGEDSEKRFHSVMDKLFHSPKPKPTSSSSGNQSSCGKGRGNSTKKSFESNTSGRSIVSVRRSKRSGSSLPSEAPICRPWDRGDLLRRLATFKSMIWFGKPKVVSAVNCARKGWINVEMDIIACEACGARLLFSNPSSWTYHQIEKAAAVFSLKLDNGHRSLCPWINNACDEKLAEFPPTTAPALADGYKERAFALVQLSALPIVSSSAIDSVRNPQLETFLENSSVLELGPGFKDSSAIEYIGCEHDAVPAHLYYQAHKFIALCGWEPRSLPYVVDCEDGSAKSAEKSHPNDSTHSVSGRNPGVIVNSLSGSDEIMEVDDRNRLRSGQLLDPSSVVLDCKLCGSSVGLWAFSTVQQPLELYRFTGSSEVNCISESANCDFTNCLVTETPRTDESGKKIRADRNGGVLTPTSMKERPLSLYLSIAGGPSPAKQNYRATISLPIISRHLRAGLSSNSNARDRMNMSCMNQITPNDVRSDNPIQQNNDQTNNTPCMHIVQPEDMGTLKRKRTEDGVCNSRDGDESCRNSESNEEDPLRKENNDDMSTKERSLSELSPPLHTLGTCPNTGLENPLENMRKGKQGLGEDDANGENSGKGVDSTYQSRDCLGSDASKSVENGETSKNNPLMTTTGEVCNHQQDHDLSGTDVLHGIVTSDASHQESCNLSSLKANATGDEVDWREGDQGKDSLRSLDVQVTKQKVGGAKSTVQSSINNEMVSSGELGKDLKSDNSDQAMEFDPIRQHRHFCPWISSTGNAAPGWQQALSALNRGKESSHLLPKDSPSKSKSEADDPIVSIRKLFMSPSAKKTKLLNDQANR